MSVLCVYGVAPASHEGELVFLEEDPARFEAFVPEPKTHCYFLEKGKEVEVYKAIAWKFLFLPMNYQTTGAPREKEVFAQLEHIRLGVHLVASDFSDFGKKVFANIVKNIERLSQAYDGSRWFGAFKNIPAIICGAGPSFAKNSAHLKAQKDNALLFGGGSALNVLAHAGIAPHIGASIDPDPPHDRREAQAAGAIPFFYQFRAASDLISLVEGPTFWIKDAEARPIEQWFTHELNLEGPALESGWNVATFCTALAAAFGCNPIIFVGLDLSSEGETLYAPGVAEEKKAAPKDWEMAGQWLEAFIRSHPDTRFINATEGGRGLAGAEPLALKDVVLTPQENLTTTLAALPKVAGPDAAQKIEILKESLRRCQGIFQERLAFPLFKTSSIEEEIAYTHILAPLWNIWQHVFARHVDVESLEGTLNKTLFLKNVTEEFLYELCD